MTIESEYYKELRENALYRFLLDNLGCKVYFASDDGYEYFGVFQANSCSVYFYWEDGTYQRTEMSDDAFRKHNSKSLLESISKIIRIEKEFERGWLPVWTKQDGFVETDYQNFVFYRNQYYTLNEIKHLIDIVHSIKKDLSDLKIC